MKNSIVFFNGYTSLESHPFCRGTKNVGNRPTRNASEARRQNESLETVEECNLYLHKRRSAAPDKKRKKE